MGELRMFDDFGLRNDIDNNSDDLLDDLYIDSDDDDDLNISEETDETTLLD